MITGHISNLKQDEHLLSPGVRKALDFLKDNDVNKLAPGRYDIDGNNIFALVQHYASRTPENCRAETHAKYLDIQYVAQGKEYMGYIPYSAALPIEEDCLKEKDACFYNISDGESKILLSEGTYAVLYPTDVHRPGMMADSAPSDVIKVVFKISIDAA